MSLNKSLKLLLQYESESESSDSSDSSASSESNNTKAESNLRNYRNNESTFEVSDSEDDAENGDSDGDLSTVETESVCSQNGDIVQRRKKKKDPYSYPEEDLPPVENLRISVPSEHCNEIGTIKHLIEEMAVVVVKSHPNQAALNIDSVLFLDRGERVLGKIYDVFGQVQNPQYVVRFDTKEKLSEANLIDGMAVYAAPKLPFSIYVFMKDVLANKGSDASWIDDKEPPPEALEFSDDEQENKFKGKAKKRKKPHS